MMWGVMNLRHPRMQFVVTTVLLIVPLAFAQATPEKAAGQKDGSWKTSDYFVKPAK